MRALGDRELIELAQPLPPAALLAELAGARDFGLEPASRRVFDRSPNALHAELENLPLRAVTGSRWDGSEHDHRRAPEHYAAIHFHRDDLYDAGWPISAEFQVPLAWNSGLYALRLRVAGERRSRERRGGDECKCRSLPRPSSVSEVERQRRERRQHSQLLRADRAPMVPVAKHPSPSRPWRFAIAVPIRSARGATSEHC
jgi:hypothetical protein